MAAWRDNPLDMSAPAGRPTWEQHPLWLDRERFDAIADRMWLEIQKTIFPNRSRRPRGSPGRTELTVVGGTSAEDVYSTAVQALLRYAPEGDVVWEAVGIVIARRKAVAAVRKAKKHRGLPDGSEIDIASLDLVSEEGERLVDRLTDEHGGMTADQVPDQVLRCDRILAIRKVADELLPQRDRDIFFRVTGGETNASIAEDVNLTAQRVGQIYRESVRKINSRLRGDPTFRRLYEQEGGSPDGS